MFFLLLIYYFFTFCRSKVIDLQQVQESIRRREAQLCEFLIDRQNENTTFKFLVSRFIKYIISFNSYKTRQIVNVIVLLL